MGGQFGCLAGDMFWRQKVGCTLMDTVIRPARLNYVHSMIVEKLKTCTTTFKPSNRIKAMVPAAKIDWFDVKLRLLWDLLII